MGLLYKAKCFNSVLSPHASESRFIGGNKRLLFDLKFQQVPCYPCGSHTTNLFIWVAQREMGQDPDAGPLKEQVQN